MATLSWLLVWGTVRLIGVDTPETVDPRKPVQEFGAEAAAFLRKLVLNKVVILSFDQIRPLVDVGPQPCETFQREWHSNRILAPARP